MTAFAGGLFALTVAAADTKADAAKVKKGLQNIGEFVGQWNLIADSTTGDKLRILEGNRHYQLEVQGG